jgi:hypothetical protein
MMEHLSEVLAVELFIAETYLQYAQQARDEDIQAELRRFSSDADRHRLIAEKLAAELDLQPRRWREVGATALAWGKGFIDLIRRGRSGTLLNLWDLLVVEHKLLSAWQMVKAVGEATGDSRVVDAADKVLSDEQKHLEWLHARVLQLAQDTMTEVVLPVATRK